MRFSQSGARQEISPKICFGIRRQIAANCDVDLATLESRAGVFRRGIRPPTQNLSEKAAGGSSSPLLDVNSGGEAAFIYHRPAERPIHLDALKSPGHNKVMLYRGFSSKLHHEVPPWVETGALFHVRIAVDRRTEQRPLTTASLAQSLLDSARFYESEQRWHITLFLLMPDHVHALLSFGQDESMSSVIGDWKHFQTRKHGIIWQDGYFDHRLRADDAANNSRQS
jgi:putative transposase